MRGFVQRFLDWQNEEPRRRFQFAVTLLDSGGLIGSAGIRRKPENDHEAEIGYELAPEQWGHGYATESASEMLDFGFRELKLHRIFASLVAENTASARVLERLGMTLEGRSRHVARFKDRWWDGLTYAILEDEWRSSTNHTPSRSS